jgi:hypothetical protein
MAGVERGKGERSHPQTLRQRERKGNIAVRGLFLVSPLIANIARPVSAACEKNRIESIK